MGVAFDSLGDTRITQPPSCFGDHLLSKFFGLFGGAFFFFFFLKIFRDTVVLVVLCFFSVLSF